MYVRTIMIICHLDAGVENILAALTKKLGDNMVQILSDSLSPELQKWEDYNLYIYFIKKKNCFLSRT